jgi:hypothetical protein
MKKIISAAFFLLIIGCFVAAFMLLNRSADPLTQSEKQQALSKILGRPVVLKEKKVATGDILYKGKYISFLYPAAAKIMTPKANGILVSSSDLENIYFSVGDSARINVTITISQASSAETSIIDDPAVRLRQLQKDLYKQTEVTVDGQPGLEFEKNDQVIEKIAFFFVNNKIYTFAVDGSDRKSMTDLYNKIILSLKFL